jgi:hypothetical protein
MTLWESGESSGDMSLQSLFEEPEKVDGESALRMEDIAYTICRGGWPKSLSKKSKKAALRQVTKLGGDTLIEEGAANLKTLAEKIDTTKMKKPSFKMVLTAVGQYAYRRTDGILAVPVGSLKD